MKKICLILVCCVLLCSMNLSVSASKTIVDDGVHPPYIADEIVLSTTYVIDLALYEGEGPFEFCGIPIVSIERTGNPALLTPEEELEMFKVVSYKITVVSGVDIFEAVDTLKNCEGVFEVGVNVLIGNAGPVISGDLADVNCDGAVDAFDYLAIKAHYFGIDTLEGHQLQRADINVDGVVDIFDYMELKIMVMGQN